MPRLVLNRTPGQTIHIGDDIRVTVARIDGNHVRLEIEAPREVEVDREEVRANPRARRPAGLPRAAAATDR